MGVKFYIIAKLRQCMTKADVDRLIANSEGTQKARFESVWVAVANPNLGN